MGDSKARGVQSDSLIHPMVGSFGTRSLGVGWEGGYPFTLTRYLSAEREKAQRSYGEIDILTFMGKENEKSGVNTKARS